MRSLRIALAVAICFLLIGGTADASASSPGVNGKIVFGSDRDGDFEIWIMDSDGSNLENLTDHPAYDRAPEWSPDGQRIAFASDRDGDTEIWIMNSDGTGLVQVTHNDIFDSGPSWSPDGSRIAFQSDRGGGKIFVIDADGGNESQVTTSVGFDQHATWSPDGQYIAFDRQSPAQIWKVRPDGTGEQQLTADVSNFEPDWSPDGSKIAWVSNRDVGSGYVVYVMDEDGSNETRVGDVLDDATTPAWSPDGSSIIVSEDDGDSFEIYTMGSDGADRQKLTDSGGDSFWPSWQPVAPVSGDANCSGNVDAVDALMDLRHVAGLASNGCVQLAGNVKCDDAVTAVDSLFILRHVAQMQATLPPGCPEIGS